MVSGLVSPGLRAGAGKGRSACAKCPDCGAPRELNLEVPLFQEIKISCG